MKPSICIGLSLFVGLCSVLSGCSIGHRQPLVDDHHYERGMLGFPNSQYSRRSWVISEKASLLVRSPSSSWLSDSQSFHLQKHAQSALARYFTEVDIDFSNHYAATGRHYHYDIQFEVLNEVERMAAPGSWLSSESDKQFGRDRVMVKVKLLDHQTQELLDVSWIALSSGWLQLRQSDTHQLLAKSFLRYAQNLSAVGVM